jgi:glycosyltransferase involved in cell wall biosynthesis
LIRDGVELFHGLTGEIPVGIRKLKIPVVVTIHDLIFLRYPKFYTFFDYKIHSMKSRYAVNNSDIVVVVSEQTRRDVIDFYGVSPEKVKVIYQGCQDVFSERFSREEIKTTLSKHGLPDNYILNVGTIEERKNILKGIMAIKETNYNMVIVGSETKYTQLIKEYIVANKMDSRVFFPKKIPSHELAMIYQGASLFLYPSLFEGFGIPIIEALYSGTPVITTVGGCFSEAGGPFSKYVDPENVEDIRVMIEEVHNNEPLRTEMIVEGEKYVQRFNTEYIGKSVNDLYQELIEQAQ